MILCGCKNEHTWSTWAETAKRTYKIIQQKCWAEALLKIAKMTLTHQCDCINFWMIQFHFHCYFWWPYSVQFLLMLELCVGCSYLLGLVAMIKCSIRSYQCDNWYVSNWRLDCHIYFWWGGAFLSLLRSPHVLHQNSTYLVAAHPLG